MKLKWILWGINILFVLVYFNTIPQFVSKVIDRVQFYTEMKDQQQQIESWQTHKNQFNVEKMALEAKISQLALDIPSTQNPIELTTVINELADRFNIQSLQQQYLKYRVSGNYIFRGLDIEFNARYQNGIEFLHAIETNRHLMMIDEITIENEKNRTQRPISFKVRLTLVLKQ